MSILNDLKIEELINIMLEYPMNIEDIDLSNIKSKLNLLFYALENIQEVSIELKNLKNNINAYKFIKKYKFSNNQDIDYISKFIKTDIYLYIENRKDISDLSKKNIFKFVLSNLKMFNYFN